MQNMFLVRLGCVIGSVHAICACFIFLTYLSNPVAWQLKSRGIYYGLTGLNEGEFTVV